MMTLTFPHFSLEAIWTWILPRFPAALDARPSETARAAAGDGRAFLLERMDLCPEAMASETGALMLMSVYPQEF